MSSNDKEVAVDKTENNDKAGGDAKAEVKGTKRAAEEKGDDVKKAKREENGEDEVEEEDEEDVEGEEEEEEEDIPEGEEEEDEEDGGDVEGEGEEDEDDAWSLSHEYCILCILGLVYIKKIRKQEKDLGIYTTTTTPPTTTLLLYNLQQRLLYKFDKEQF